MNGAHPFDSGSKSRNSIVDNIRSEKSPFVLNLMHRQLDSGFYVPPFEMLPSSLNHLFELTFIEGANTPRKRPSAENFWRELTQLLKEENLYTCYNVPWHIFPDVVSECPWCEVEKRRDEYLKQQDKIRELVEIPIPHMPKTIDETLNILIEIRNIQGIETFKNPNLFLASFKDLSHNNNQQKAIGQLMRDILADFEVLSILTKAKKADNVVADRILIDKICEKKLIDRAYAERAVGYLSHVVEYKSFFAEEKLSSNK